MNSPEIKKFIKKNEALFWDIGFADKENLTPEALMETVLNYGDIITIKHLFDLIGLEKAAEIFHNTPERRKNNYLPLVRNFFTLYFKRHVQRILTDAQINLLPFLKLFKKEYYLAGGTAIALYIGHRRSIDYDLFSAKSIQKQVIKKQLIDSGLEYQLRYEDSDQLHMSVMGVKITFFQYPFHIPIKTTFESVLNLPDLLDLAAMKAYAFAMRAKWKDYIDIYFLLKNHFTLKEICERAAAIYKNAFSEKLFRQQLCYFGDIDYSEQPEYMNEKISDNEIRTFLIDISTTPF